MTKRKLRLLSFSVVPAAHLLTTPASAEVTFDWVIVPLNTVADTEVMTDGTTGYGAVSYTYWISKYEVTNTQYTEFLNAVAAADPNDLYNTSMGSGLGGITRSGTSGSFTYSTIAGRENKPVNFVSFYDALRFANWLHNGQPVGAQGNSTTEDGAYTITAAGIAANSTMRNPGATVFLTSEDEWYKAAYYDPASPPGIYYDFPASTDTPTTCALPGPTANTGNCENAVGDLTDVGSYTGSPSPIGTFDQCGNVWEWNESILPFGSRSIRGSAFEHSQSQCAASYRDDGGPTNEQDHDEGFRVASTAAPVPSLSPLGIALLCILLALAGWRRVRV